MARHKTSKIDRKLTSLANSLTSEQIIKLYQFIDPITDDERAGFNNMTDDELLDALKE